MIQISRVTSLAGVKKENFWRVFLFTKVLARLGQSTLNVKNITFRTHVFQASLLYDRQR